MAMPAKQRPLLIIGDLMEAGIEAGIIDPTKVVRRALENAVSVAGVLLLGEATMTEPPGQPKQQREVEP